MSLLLALALASGGGPVPPLRVPILMYHHIAVAPPGQTGTSADVSLPPDAFSAHLDYLERAGYTTVTLAEVRGFLEARAAAPPRPVVLTFDDGDAGHWGVFETLKARGMKGVFFVVVDSLGDGAHLTRDQLEAMDRQGMEIGSHSLTHWDLKDLGKAEQEREILGSQAALETLLGHEVISFCYPGGRYDGVSLRILARSRYYFARSTLPGVAAIGGRSFELKTIPIFRGTTVRRLAWKLAHGGS